MTTYNYALVITGKVIAPHDVQAKLQVLMGVTLSARLLQTSNEIAIQIAEETPTTPDNGSETEQAPAELRPTASPTEELY